MLLVEDLTETQMLEDKLVHSERLASIGRLAAGVAHEIGNPITGIACLAQNLREEREEDGELTEISGQILEQTKRVSRIVQSLMASPTPAAISTATNRFVWPKSRRMPSVCWR